MKRIIDGKTYNTETAERLAGASDGNRHGDGSAYWTTETLYRTKKGAFFIAGRGNALSPYGQPDGYGMSMPGSAIRALSEAEVRQWVERYGNASFEEAFGKVEAA